MFTLLLQLIFKESKFKIKSYLDFTLLCPIAETWYRGPWYHRYRDFEMQKGLKQRFLGELFHALFKMWPNLFFDFLKVQKNKHVDLYRIF